MVAAGWSRVRAGGRGARVRAAAARGSVCGPGRPRLRIRAAAAPHPDGHGSCNTLSTRLDAA